ncbi:MAG: sensor histidine kinase [Synechococcales cyanobacterium C42_A2020_086]|jgi:signal transduction histidine kinase|nr:sensor histidine kinase [Synechococcales cyanobacterium C42_A2020_086]
MPASDRPRSKLPHPRRSEGKEELEADSILADLPLYDFAVTSHHIGLAVAQRFEQYPQLPGVILQERGRLLGMISRQRLLEFLLRPQGVDLFLSHSIAVLHSYARTPPLLLSDSTSILVAAQLALRRMPEQRGEPIVVQLQGAMQRYHLLDAHELNIAYWQIRGIETQVRYERMQVQMIQAEKMASLGRLVDGVAHEILDPVGFIWGNLTHLSTYTQQVMQLLAAYETHLPTPPTEIAALQTEIELDYLRQDLPQTIASIRAGAERLKRLVTSLQNFCHIDDVYPKPADLHECLDSILLLLKSRLTGDIQVVRHYGHLPPITCYAGQLNQVFMNILTNAIDALLNQTVRQEITRSLQPSSREGSWQPDALKPQITITTQVRPAPVRFDPALNPDTNSVSRLATQPISHSVSAASRWVSVRIADNGPGIPPEKQQQILDSFSVEKRASKETSLAVSYQIVTAKHGGQFRFRSWTAAETPMGDPSASGTEFEILLPLV